MKVVTYRLAYPNQTTSLCEQHAASPRVPIGPVQYGEHEGHCDECSYPPFDEADGPCPKCGDPAGPDRYGHDCPYVGCDDPTCRALENPPDEIESLRVALEHWRSHSLHHGCSHGD